MGFSIACMIVIVRCLNTFGYMLYLDSYQNDFCYLLAFPFFNINVHNIACRYMPKCVV